MSAPLTAPATTEPDRHGRGLWIADGTLEALKWLALVLMVLDHTNKWLLDGKAPYVFEAARVVAPIFCFVLAHNLARPGAFHQGMHRRVAWRLTLAGLAATPAFAALNGSLWPLNILFELLAGVVIVHGTHRGTATSLAMSGVVFAAGGLLGEYFHPGLMMFVAAWVFSRNPSTLTFMAWTASVALLTPINGNWWAMLAVPLMWVATQTRIELPRWRPVFYVAYPLHLALLVALR